MFNQVPIYYEQIDSEEAHRILLLRTLHIEYISCPISYDPCKTFKPRYVKATLE
jgi:hypothetical protein